MAYEHREQFIKKNVSTNRAHEQIQTKTSEYRQKHISTYKIRYMPRQSSYIRKY